LVTRIRSAAAFVTSLQCSNAFHESATVEQNGLFYKREYDYDWRGATIVPD